MALFGHFSTTNQKVPPVVNPNLLQMALFCRFSRPQPNMYSDLSNNRASTLHLQKNDFA